MAQFSLSWDAYKQNICGGLSSLQQNGELVDMTIAADGHHVKVHQLVLCLASPYLKDLISSLQCPHPVIFLNKVSYPILCALLEYIYTGEVLIAKENLQELLLAAKELHIKGLSEMKLELAIQPTISQSAHAKRDGQPLSETAHCEKTDKKILHKSFTETESQDVEESADTDHLQFEDPMDIGNDCSNTKQVNKPITEPRIQYTTTSHGCLQMILNRFLYYLRYTSKKGAGAAGHRQWRCIEYTKSAKCPAAVITQDDIIVQRFGVHNHPFHDNKILKKVRDNAVYTALREAEVQGHNLKQQRQSQPDDEKLDDDAE